MVDTARLSGERLAEFERDRHESNRRYDYAFSVVLSHTSALELQEFSKLVGLGDGSHWLTDSGTAAGSQAPAQASGTEHFQTNPMAEAEGWRTGAVKDKRSGSASTGSTEFFEHANPAALDESAAAAAGPAQSCVA